MGTANLPSFNSRPQLVSCSIDQKRTEPRDAVVSGVSNGHQGAQAPAPRIGGMDCEWAVVAACSSDYGIPSVDGDLENAYIQILDIDIFSTPSILRSRFPNPPSPLDHRQIVSFT